MNRKQLKFKDKVFLNVTALSCMTLLSLAYPANSYAAHITEIQQTKSSVSGTITDNQGEPLIGVSVKEKGTSTGTTTDLDGKFVLAVSNPNAALSITYVGYVSQDIALNGRKTLTIELTDNSEELDEVIVTAYGSQKKSSFTGSASIVSDKKLEALQPVNITQGLQGLSAGVQVINNSGRPGDDGTVVIRGLGSMTANSSPLYVIDGVPSDIPLNSISYSDIESITVLKDAASTSLYGSRAGNGVILITTKKGKSGKTTINLRASWATSDFAVKFPKKVSAAKQYELTFEGLYNDATDFMSMNDQQARQYAYDNVTKVFWNTSPVTLNDGTVRQYRSGWNMDNPVGLDGKIKPDAKRLWEEDLFDQAFSNKLKQDYGVDISGSLGDKNSYFMSISMLDDKGIFIADHFKRFTGRAALTSKLSKWFSMDNSILFASSTNYNGGFAARVFRVYPSEYSAYLWDHKNNQYAVSEYTGGKVLDEGWNNGRAWWPKWSPYGALNERVKNWNDNVQTVSALTFTILPELTLKSTSSFQLQNVYNNNWRSPEREGTLIPAEGSVTRAAYRNTSHTINNVLVYDKVLGNDHHLNVMLGQEAYKYTTNGFGAYRKGLNLPIFTEISTAEEDPTAWSGTDNYALASFFSRINYDFKNRYYISGSIRTDGSSRFASDNRWGTFYSVGASWRITEESFMKSTKSWLDNLKIKASYGEVGNDNVGYYPYLGLFETSSYGGKFGVVQSQLSNKNIKWETNVQANLGLDFSIFNNKVNGTFEVFSRKSKDLLLSRPLAPSLGMSSIMENIGDIKNTGWEIELNYNAIKTKDFDWNIGLNATHYKNEITRLPSKEETFNVGVGVFKWKEGASRYDLYAPVWADVNPENGRNRWYKYTFDETGKITGKEKTENYSEVNVAEQRIKAGSTLPDVYGSITNNFRYKDFDLSVMLYYSLGGVVYDYNYAESTVLRENFAAYDYLDNRWQKPGDVTDVAKIYTYRCFDASSYARYSDKFIFKNNFARLRNIVLGYSIPRDLVKKLGIGSLRFYVKGDNLLTFGKLKNHGTDPENFNATNVAGGVIDGESGVPALKTYSFGLNIQF